MLARSSEEAAPCRKIDGTISEVEKQIVDMSEMQTCKTIISALFANALYLTKSVI